MKAFMDEDFLLGSETARQLYHDHAAKQPIIDYHCHVNPEEIAENRTFENITQVWLGGDHYKWRMIRSNGVDENKITGDVSDREKFQMFAEALAKSYGNPLYHWTHLELKRYFNYHGVLNGDTAEEVWNLCNTKIKELSVRDIIDMSGVEVIVTTDDPVDSLEAHKKISEDETCKVTVLPGWRPDKAVNINKTEFKDYLEALSQASGVKIDSLTSLKQALSLRLDHFESLGCKASDHGLDYVPYAEASESDVEKALAKALSGENLSDLEIDQYKCHVMLFLGREYSRRGWVMQLHYGALRNANSRMLEKMGPDTGFDAVGKAGNPDHITAFMDTLQRDGMLPKTILYSLNPSDNAMLGTIIGCFQGSEMPGKVQHGAAWWFNDTKTGMEEQLISLANLSVLGNCIGMLTDSRSFLSYTRHEYFRRILCNLLGSWAENGEVPADISALGKMAEDISYNNVKRYFEL